MGVFNDFINTRKRMMCLWNYLYRMPGNPEMSVEYVVIQCFFSRKAKDKCFITKLKL